MSDHSLAGEVARNRVVHSHRWVNGGPRFTGEIVSDISVSVIGRLLGAVGRAPGSRSEEAEHRIPGSEFVAAETDELARDIRRRKPFGKA